MSSIWKKAKSILHIILLILGLVLLVLHFDYVCLGCSNNHILIMQFADATIGGFAYIMFVLFVGLCVNQELQRKTQMAISYTGAICYALTLVTFIHYLINDDSLSRLVGSAVVCGLLTAGYFFEAIWLTVKKDLDQQVE